MSIDKVKRAHERVTRRYVLGLLLLAAAIFGEQYFAHRIVASGQHDAFVLSISGEQRMWSQRIVSLSQQLLTGNEQFQSLETSTDEQRVAELRRNIDEMRQTHARLTRGDAFIDLDPPTDPRLLDIYFGDEVGLEYLLVYFLSLADHVVDAQVNGDDATNAVVMMVMLRDGLLQALDSAVSTYVVIASEKTAMLRNIQAAHVIVIALLLMLEVIFIFRPMARRVRSVMDELVREKNQLSEGLQREAEIASFAENSPEPIISLDAKGQFLYANPAADEIVRAIKSGKVSIAVLLREPLREFLQRKNTESFTFELGGKRYDGLAVPYTTGKFINFYFHDVTSLKEAEQKATTSQRMEAIGQLTGGVAHDFNNLLMVITGSLQLALSKLRGEARNQEMAENLIESALGAVDRTAGLTRNLLAFSRRQQLAPEAVDVAAAIGSFQPLLKNAAGGAVDLEIRDNGEGRSSIKVDRGQLEAALLNLVINARDAMPDGGNILIETRELFVTAEAAARYENLSPGEYVVVAVTDSGSGMPAHIKTKVLEPFFTTKEVGQGSGLGLSMVWGFVKQSGGHVTIYSEEGIGTTIRMIFPLSRVALPKPRETAPSDNNDGMLKPGALILLAEDNDDLRTWLSSELEALGYEVLATGTGKEALRTVHERAEIAFVVSDIFMPDGMTGLQLSEEIHAYREDLPVLLISGFPSGSVPMVRGRQVLSKPFSRAELAGALNRTVQEKAA